MILINSENIMKDNIIILSLSNIDNNDDRSDIIREIKEDERESIIIDNRLIISEKNMKEILCNHYYMEYDIKDLLDIFKNEISIIN